MKILSENLRLRSFHISFRVHNFKSPHHQYCESPRPTTLSVKRGALAGDGSDGAVVEGRKKGGATKQGASD